MTDAERLVEKVAEALWVAFVTQHVHSEDWPTWGELLAQGHQGLGRVNQFRALALAALAVAEPLVREDCIAAARKALAAYGRWQGAITPETLMAKIEPAIRASAVEPPHD